MVVGLIFIIVQNSRFVLIAVTQTAVSATAFYLFFYILVISYQFRHIVILQMLIPQFLCNQYSEDNFF